MELKNLLDKLISVEGWKEGGRKGRGEGEGRGDRGDRGGGEGMRRGLGWRNFARNLLRSLSKIP